MNKQDLANKDLDDKDRGDLSATGNLAIQLIEQLDNSSSLNDADLMVLQSLEVMIESKLFEHDSRESPDQYLLERFQERVMSFEQQHPAFSGILRRISNSLSNIGV